MQRCEELFQEADANKDGELSFAELERQCELVAQRYPQLAGHLQNVKEVFERYDVDGSRSLQLNEFKNVLADVDKEMRPFPATAQVAAQQGTYVAEQLTR